MLNKKQMAFFQQLYAFVHDERSSCQNLQGMIDLLFPDPDADQLSHDLHGAIKTYLKLREDAGYATMEWIYAVHERLIKASNDAGCDEEDKNGS